MEQGIIKFYQENKQFGFITMENEKDIFFHISGVKNKEGMTHHAKDKACTFDITDGKKGPEATNVILVN